MTGSYGNYQPNIVSESLDYERPTCGTGTGTGGIQIFAGTGEPPAVPAATDPGFENWPDPAPDVALYLQTDTGQIWQWVNGAWS